MRFFRKLPAFIYRLHYHCLLMMATEAKNEHTMGNVRGSLRFPSMLSLLTYRLRTKGSLKWENIPNLRRCVFCDWVYCLEQLFL